MFPAAFYFYLASRFCAGAAMTMFRAAIAWHVFDLSHSAFHLGLIGLVQMGVLEIHPWGSRAQDVEKPDRIVQILDPQPDRVGLFCGAVAASRAATGRPRLHGKIRR